MRNCGSSNAFSSSTAVGLVEGMKKGKSLSDSQSKSQMTQEYGSRREGWWRVRGGVEGRGRASGRLVEVGRSTGSASKSDNLGVDTPAEGPARAKWDHSQSRPPCLLCD
jgi:hypothetical protein